MDNAAKHIGSESCRATLMSGYSGSRYIEGFARVRLQIG